jgi:hypothetical protein
MPGAHGDRHGVSSTGTLRGLGKMLDKRTKSLIRGLIYPVQFEQNPINGADRAWIQVIQANALGANPSDYLAAIETALKSDELLARLLPQDHSEADIRKYLASLRKRLKSAGQLTSPAVLPSA